MTPETRPKRGKAAPASSKHGETSVTRSKTAKSAAIAKAMKPAALAKKKPAKSGQYRPSRLPAGSYTSSTEVAQVRLRPDEMADLRLVMQSLNLASVSDALREGLRLLSREAAEVAASEEIRAFYQGDAAPLPTGALPATAEELEAADEFEW
ncbi:hypothetical protein [Streptomyces sp. NBC_00989]|uniref:hypothetical protein n=1 Tax=Streptomyces sp. NBC_00989 TaxID=2903705 RepID=UPI0038630FC3|nr:hypothetical protein OG714_17660 [Streptomyces sp. NBC_00989]